MDTRFTELEARLAQIVDLASAARLLGWDQQTMMPRAGAAARAEALATLERMCHELLVADGLVELLEELRPLEESLPAETREASLIRVARRDVDKARRVPPELTAEIARASALAQHVWVEARAASDYPRFRPYLERNIELKREYVACFEPEGEPYDVLLDDYEHGTTAAEVRAVFDELKAGLVPLIAEVGERAGRVDDALLHGVFPADRQQQVVQRVLERFGFDEESWRLDLTAHPFATSLSATDVRLTTRYSESDLSGLFSAMHEFGHGLYERGSDQALERTLLAGGVSLGLHESQSRLWENLVGRGRPFWRWLTPMLREAFPETLAGADPEELYRAANVVRPSLIRVDADQVTYSLHVILRFELEQELLAGSIPLTELPEVWNARMREYLGVEVPDDAHGVLQDIHWSSGIFGYFPTYVLGSVASVQIWEAATRDLPHLEDDIAAGEFGPLREWLRERLHRHGRKFTPKETLELVAGGPLDPAPFLAYLKAKVLDLYGGKGQR